jgi:hypothetical protein
LNVVPDNGIYTFLQVNYQGLAIQTPNDANPVSYAINGQPPPATAAVLDSGTNDIYLPFDQWQFLANKVNAFTVDDEQIFRVDCGVKQWPGSVGFTFSAFTVQVPFSELVQEYDVNKCSFKVQPALTRNILGTNFLRRVFVVYDLAAKTITMSRSA